MKLLIANRWATLEQWQKENDLKEFSERTRKLMEPINPELVELSENSIESAGGVVGILSSNDPKLGEIVNPERIFDTTEMVDNLREDHLTRCRLFEYLQGKLDDLIEDSPESLASRVLLNSAGNLKSPNFKQGYYGVEKMRSREYTIVLAIAMMDGSFNVDIQDKTVTHYRDGRERSGMHRDSARVLLEYVSKRDNY
ncbi:hypothetical protein KOY49_01420 [Candidatus Minimicrobia vallesae]|uniref:Uncharacterized protein n=1 Tax=Candidatus Minimicrobia vallesae TaxID=2841264 RepID=A0A8F1MA52_9BACT|nr:hypothetical protein [Candidatus Minimicrobia vallesae]QWQ31656.1 hypothetical protein KOY49_01420 [Candidatus Minimicrobia vallesae]